MPVSQSEIRNRLLSGMEPADFAAVRPRIEKVELKMRTVLVEKEAAIEDVYFIESGIASVVATSQDDERIEVGHVGWEGMSGSSAALGVMIGSTRTFMQVAGSGWRMAVRDLEAAFVERPEIRERLLQYVYTQEVQVAHSALANARYSIKERLARWLLMSHDRGEGDDLSLTHEFLSLMLGVRRAGVTGELHILEGMSLIRATRGNIRILDRPRLEEIAGGCYGYPEMIYERLLGKVRSEPLAAR
ncbi:Crp/Fnr family transcriptional regulator [Aureimonas glaciei]|jgi:CRP-like cAMP-binding protein|uniref:Cyclic nucleotide-binding protein n=1 Tax=Aureimonas glaciei TaxID=1776957 RepID=A0A916XY16_9HYPH|nr:Crp/Fnr family transcriptional regulator [Aureimonas glaciei]GGD18702.1 cyclic nucleotide-binding protein [Aureimonas glaciei]